MQRYIVTYYNRWGNPENEEIVNAKRIDNLRRVVITRFDGIRIPWAIVANSNRPTQILGKIAYNKWTGEYIWMSEKLKDYPISKTTGRLGRPLYPIGKNETRM